MVNSICPQLPAVPPSDVSAILVAPVEGTQLIGVLLVPLLETLPLQDEELLLGPKVDVVKFLHVIELAFYTVVTILGLVVQSFCFLEYVD